jgi:hypothetical protein
MRKYLATSDCVMRGIPEETFAKLDARTFGYLLKVMARVAERAYRRGAQQGVHIAQNRPQDLPKDLGDWRYGPSADKSVGLDTNTKFATTAVERLEMESGDFARIIGMFDRRPKTGRRP